MTTIFEWIISLTTLLVSVPLHELGHYIAARKFKFNPHFTHCGVDLCIRFTSPDKLTKEVEVQQYIVAFAGIMGIIPFFVMLQETWWMIIFFMAYSIYEVLRRRYLIRKWKNAI